MRRSRSEMRTSSTSLTQLGMPCNVMSPWRQKVSPVAASHGAMEVLEVTIRCYKCGEWLILLSLLRILVTSQYPCRASTVVKYSKIPLIRHHRDHRHAGYLNRIEVKLCTQSPPYTHASYHNKDQLITVPHVATHAATKKYYKHSL